MQKNFKRQKKKNPKHLLKLRIPMLGSLAMVWWNEWITGQ